MGFLDAVLRRAEPLAECLQELGVNSGSTPREQSLRRLDTVEVERRERVVTGGDAARDG